MVLPSYLYFILISLIASLVQVFYPVKELYLKVFIFFLFITLVVEVVNSNLSARGIPNVMVYNFFSAFEVLFYLYVLSQIIHNKVVKKVIYHLTWIYLLIFLGNIMFVQKNTFHSMTYALGSLMIVAFCIFYFFELFKLPHSVILVREPAFWICCGILFFYCCSFPIFGLINLVNPDDPGLLILHIEVIVTVMNISLYTLLTIAFLCRIRTRKYML